MGRAGAFVAKADDPTAIYFNPAGLARQRGTQALFHGNYFLHSFEFQRIGAYPDDPNDAQTPWGAAPYPVVQNEGGSSFSPFLAATSDFGRYDRLTAGAGIFAAPTVGTRTFPLGVDGRPSPSRYDVIQSRMSLLFPTLSAGYRLTRWLDVGLSAHVVLGSFERSSTAYVDYGGKICKENTSSGTKLREDFRCDSTNVLQAQGIGFGATLGMIARPSRAFAIGLALRSPVTIRASGMLTPEVPQAAPDDQKVRPGAATYDIQVPWLVRAGARFVRMDGDFELYDIEVNGTYEAWGTAQGLGPIMTVPALGDLKDIQAILQHGYKNTFSARVGGAYNIDLGESVLSLRAGAFFDSAATEFKDTRIDVDTLAKIAGTVGGGLKFGAFTVDLGYAAVASIPRLVGTGEGDIRPINFRAGGEPIAEDESLLVPVNEGAYRGFTHVISLGVSVLFDSFFGPPRKIRYGNSYEPNYDEHEEAAPESTPQETPPPEPEPSKDAMDPKPEASDEAREKAEKTETPEKSEKSGKAEKPERPKKPAPKPAPLMPDDDKPAAPKPVKPAKPAAVPPPRVQASEEEDDEDEEEAPAPSTKKKPPVKRPSPPRHEADDDDEEDEEEEEAPAPSKKPSKPSQPSKPAKPSKPETLDPGPTAPKSGAAKPTAPKPPARAPSPVVKPPPPPPPPPKEEKPPSRRFEWWEEPE